MSEKHTPGPWTAQIGARHVDVEADDWIITETDTHKSDSPPRAQCIANARLIAAAPDLLDALQQIVSTCNVRIDDPRITLFDAARAAIAKATGGDHA